MKTLSAAAVDVLDRSLVSGFELRLPAEQLDRKLYLEVNAALEAIGGKWSRKAKAHLFEESPVDALDQVLVDGGFHDKKRDLGQFFTPPDLAQRVVARAAVRGKSVLEPSAGAGALAIEALRQGASLVNCIEADVDASRRLRSALKAEYPEAEEGVARPCWTVAVGDYLTMAGGHCHAAVMNPPFARQQDILHVTKASFDLLNGGRLVAIMSAGVKFRSNRVARDFRALVDSVHGTIEDLPEGSFRESGTDVRAVLVTMDKPR